MIDIPIPLSFLFSFLATIGFAVFYNSPKRALIPAGITGGLGWTIYVLLFKLSYNSIFANFIAAALVSIMGEILARKMKQPAILFVIPGILPLVPGLGMYNTMLYMVQKDYNLAISTGADTLFISASISLGVLVITSLSKTFNIVQLRKQIKLQGFKK
ncbi:threonine/serine exporter [Romboutsia maritimum]|uniref:Threonine/serine exporter n=1 Tax=Romboutsia maritimum TaxID=2020948 RepID=A0A371IRC1_9FIRM|nr:threonine/serine exporter family protein [Romboutsia maritimum]RDY23028.1 threonine/serine exporter [Romboutsia maritimum]